MSVPRRTPHPRRPRRLLTLGLAAGALVLAGCGVILDGGTLTAPPDEVGDGEVAIELFGDATGSTVPLVEVFFGDSGPYRFVLDTGASRTLVDAGIVDELQLPTGAPARGSGMAAGFEGVSVEVDNWRLGAVELQPRSIIGAAMPEFDQGPAIQGLLGSDVLAGFGVAEIDYDRQILTLRSGD